MDVYEHRKSHYRRVVTEEKKKVSLAFSYEQMLTSGISTFKDNDKKMRKREREKMNECERLFLFFFL